MAIHGESELIDNFIMELQPYLALIDQGVEELARPAPNIQIVDQALESLAIIRDASSVLAFDGLVRLTSTLEVTIENLLDSVTPDPGALLVRARAMAAGIHRYMDTLADGYDTDELVSRVLQPFEEVQPAELLWLDPGDFVVSQVDPELREIFEEEATELLASFTRGALMLVSAPDRPALLAGLRRDAHTLKGAANMTGFPLVGSLGASIETLLDAHIDGDVPVERDTLGVVLSARKLLTGMLASLDDLIRFVEPARTINARAAAIQTRIAPHGPATAEAVANAADALDATQPLIVTESEPEPDRLPGVEAKHAVDDMVSVWDALDEPALADVDDAQPFAFEPDIFEPEPVAEVTPEPEYEEIATDGEPEPLADEPELDVYEMAAEIAQLARLRTSLLPQNATFFPTDISALTDDIDALSAEFVDNGPSDLSIVQDRTGDQPAVSAARIDIAIPPQPNSLTLLAGMAQEEESLGHALLDLAFDNDETPGIAWPTNTSTSTNTDSLVSDERMQQQLRETFAIEAAEYADSLTLAVMALERDPESDDALRELTRVLHTLKGAAAATGFDEIGERCHSIEDELAAGVDINRAFTDMILELASQIERATTGGDLPLDASAQETAIPDPAQPVTRTAGDLRVEMRRLDGLLNLVGELVINRSTLDQRLQRLSASLDELAHMTERLRRSGQTLERVAGKASLFGLLPAAPGDDRIVPFAGATARGHNLRHEFDTLEMDRYTDLDVLARELGEVASDIGAVAGEVRNLRGDFETVSAHQRRLTNDIQDELMGIRMVPLATLAPLLQRVVRRVANETGKDVDLVIEGSEIAFDKSLVDALGDALLHLLRNAVDHGIEPPSARWASGKPERGRIVVRAWQDRGNAIVEVIDDGHGVDTARLVERARAYGFVTAEHISEAEALQLMFLPGFTTRESASSISGRGVGLDAVREAVERVKGRVTVDTKPGIGTIFQLRLPVMLAVAQAFLVEAGGRRYAVPLADVDFVASRRQATLSRVGSTALVEINETLIPAIDLATRLAGDAERLDEQTGWLLVTRSGGEPRAMRVDALNGQQEIVVKPLGRYLSAAPGVSGATILGDGQLALIIDVAEVTGKRALAPPTAEPAQPTPLDSARSGSGTALIVDDSLSVRRVLARTLERNGWTALQAHDGVEALELVQAGGIDIVVTDIEMPRMDGFELIGSLRRGGWQSLPIVVLTSRSSSKHREKAIELGANAYIVKPFQEQELLQTLERETVAIRVAG